MADLTDEEVRAKLAAKGMPPEAVALYGKLKPVAHALREKKLELERCRRDGFKLENEVMALKAEVHSIKDQLSALAAEE